MIQVTPLYGIKRQNAIYMSVHVATTPTHTEGDETVLRHFDTEAIDWRM